MRQNVSRGCLPRQHTPPRCEKRSQKNKRGVGFHLPGGIRIHPQGRAVHAACLHLPSTGLDHDGVLYIRIPEEGATYPGSFSGRCARFPSSSRECHLPLRYESSKAHQGPPLLHGRSPLPARTQALPICRIPCHGRAGTVEKVKSVKYLNTMECPQMAQSAILTLFFNTPT